MCASRCVRATIPRSRCGSSARICASQAKTITLAGRPTLTGRDLVVPSDLSSAAFFIVAALLLPGSRLDDSRRRPESDPFHSARFSGRHGRGHSHHRGGEPEWRIGRRVGGHQFARARRSDRRSNHRRADRRDSGAGGAWARPAKKASSYAMRPNCASRKPTASPPSSRICAAWASRPRNCRMASPYPGRQRFHAAELDSFGDHRIAMAFAVAALCADAESVMQGAEAASVSFPEFFPTLEQTAR